MKKRNFFIMREIIYEANPDGSSQEIKKEAEIITTQQQQNEPITQQQQQGKEVQKNSGIVITTQNYNEPVNMPANNDEQINQPVVTTKKKMSQDELNHFLIVNSL